MMNESSELNQSMEKPVCWDLQLGLADPILIGSSAREHRVKAILEPHPQKTI